MHCQGTHITANNNLLSLPNGAIPALRGDWSSITE